jgi:hypothetical protein
MQAGGHDSVIRTRRVLIHSAWRGGLVAWNSHNGASNVRYTRPMTTRLCCVVWFAPGPWNSPANRGGGVIGYNKVIEATPNPHPRGMTRRHGHSELSNRCLECEACTPYDYQPALCHLLRSWRVELVSKPGWGGVLIDYDKVIEATMPNPHPCGLTRRPGHSKITTRCLECEVCSCYGTPQRTTMPYRALLDRWL